MNSTNASNDQTLFVQTFPLSMQIGRDDGELPINHADGERHVFRTQKQG